MTKFIVGNWKMNGLQEQSFKLAGALAALEPLPGQVALCPPYTALAKVYEAIHGTNIALGAQNCHQKVNGAYTGDISAEMLKDAGCDYVILGHSERRHAYKETSDRVQAKAETAHMVGLKTIICVGEIIAERKAGWHEKVVKEQLLGSIPPHASRANTIIAYEPVWAIGTGNTATLQDIEAMHNYINSIIAQHWPEWGGEANPLYGGSVNAENAADILRITSVGGALVGGASLKADDFAAIVRAA